MDICESLRPAIAAILGKDGETIGTGFFVTSDGYILTCRHIVIPSYSFGAVIHIRTFNDKIFNAEIIENFSSNDENVDFAVLKVSTFDHPCLLLGTEFKPRDRWCTLTMSLSSIYEGLPNQGIILSKAKRKFDGRYNIYLKAESSIMGGASGSPVLNERTGAVIGIIVGALTKEPHDAFATSLEDIFAHWPELNELNLKSSHIIGASMNVKYDDVQISEESIGVLGEKDRKGPSTHIATDQWTLEDALGYNIYAYAIYRFMTHPETSNPLTISIQAPWGGGKTSLMRMVQKYLDPTAIQDIKKSVSVPTGSISLGQVLDEISYLKENNKIRDLPQANIAPETEDQPHRFTIWFNAWKYQSTNEVWAGLADAIINQISARLSPLDREKFWLRLNLKRVDADKIRQQIYEKIINYTWQKSLPWLLAFCAVLFISTGATITGILNQSSLLQYIGGSSAVLCLLASGALIKGKYEDAKKTVEGEPAAISLSQYLQMPDYSSELGFIHHVEADLRKVFESLPNNYLPLVVFIDDLDRCLPQKISEVVEGINLFLAGDFPECMFIIGMDTEMVAGALNAAHAQVISYIPKEAAVPIGWRFMDKFVQLPFIIPPSESVNLERYMDALLSKSNRIAIDPIVSRLVNEITPKVHDLKSIDSEIAGIIEKNSISKEQLDLLKERLTGVTIFQNLDKGIGSFNDENAEICRLISKSASEFSDNPRDLKRFINAFRFQYFLRWARLAQDLDVISLDQLQRWIVLMMKWPDVVRWIHRGGRYIKQVEDDKERTMSQNRLQQLEKIGENADTLESWQEKAFQMLKLDKEAYPWLKDDALRQFFLRENTYPEEERLSYGTGRGLW